jgi:hypothetical protein
VPVILNIYQCSINIISPNGGEDIPGGSNYRITWNTGENPIGCSICYISLHYSTQSGVDSYPNPIVEDITNNGYFNWQVSKINSSTIRLKIIAKDCNKKELTLDISDSNFTIDSTPPETKIILNPQNPNENGWYTNDVNVSSNHIDYL